MVLAQIVQTGQCFAINYVFLISKSKYKPTSLNSEMCALVEK